MTLIRYVLARQRLRRLTLSVLILGALGLCASLMWLRFKAQTGDPSVALADDWWSGHRIVSRDGTLLRELPNEDNRRGRPIALDEIGERVILATLAAEDSEFFEHDGVDRVAILRAVGQNLRHGELVSGASTITQQLVKLLDTRGIPGQRTASVKLREAARAQNLEQNLSKEEILEAYFNRLPYGHGLVGPEAAADGYFGARSHQLSWAQATFIAVLPRAPSYLDPYAHPERVIKRQHALLAELQEADVLTPSEVQRARQEPIELDALGRPFSAPHFVQMLLAEERVTNGATTTTTLDALLQGDVEGLVRTQLHQLQDRSVDDAAVLVIDNSTGDVLAYVGSADFHDPEIAGQVDMVRAPRQPGSTLKPFVYAHAFASGLLPTAVVADVRTEFVEGAGRVYAPRNFHGDFLGPLPAREALAASLNVPVVRIASAFDRGALLTLLRQLGMLSLDQSPEHYGLSLALGSGEVSMRELAAAYVALARGGESLPLRYVSTDPDSVPHRVIDPAIAAVVTDALSDPSARVRLLRGRSPFDIGFPVAVKTGTSSGYRDTWTAGYTRERTVVVWVGNADGSAMHRVTGASGAGPLFADVMRRAMNDVPARAPLWDHDLLTTAEVCPLSGTLATDACPGSVARAFAPDHLPTEPCALHRHIRSDSEGLRCDAKATQVAAVFGPEYDDYLASLPDGAPGKDPYGTPWYPARELTGCGESEQSGPPELRVVAPTPGATILLAHDGRGLDRIPLEAVFDGPKANRPRRVEFVVDAQVVATVPHPYRALIELGPGDHELYARPANPKSRVRLDEVRFSVR